MIRYLWLSVRRLLMESRTLFVLSVVGVALGVASVVAIQTLNQGALNAFGGSVRAVSGQADLTVTGTVPTIDETLLVDVLGDAQVTSAWPLCRVKVAVMGRPELTLEVIGTDIFAPLSYPILGEDAEGDIRSTVIAAVIEPGWVALTPDLAAEQGWSVGDTLTVSSGSRTATLTIGALVDFQRLEPLAPRGLAVMDIAQAQGLLARRGKIHQIDLKLLPGTDPAEAAARLEARLGPCVRVLTPEQRDQDARSLLAAFRLNLTALSLISLFVGVFLVLTSVQASLVRRRREFGILRSLGTRRLQIFGLVLAEASVLGGLGVATGIPLGFLVAKQNIATVSATLTSIYVLEGIDKLVLPWTVIALGVAVGLGGALAGAVLPALDLARRDPLQLLAPVTLHRRAGRRAVPLAWASLGIAVVGTAWLLLAGMKVRWGGFAYGAMMMIALPLVVPLMVLLVGRMARPGSMGPMLSLRNLVARLQTSSFAVAALAVTVSMMISVTLLVGSFRETLSSWLDVTICADVYITTESWQRAGNEAFLDGPFLVEMESYPGVAAVELQRRMQVRTADGRHKVWLNGIRVAGIPGTELAGRLPLVEGDPGEVTRRLEAGAVLIGEPLARKASLDRGDTLRLAGPHGTISLPIAGVTYDYTSEGGTGFVLMPTLIQHFDPGPPNNAALFLEDPGSAATVAEALASRYRATPLIFRSNRDLRAEVMDIFDQTFAVTRTLQTMALLTAVCGVALTLLIQTRERAGELALLRALGASRRQIFGLFLGEGSAMGLMGMALGLGGGIGLAALLILVVNRQYFGWTIQPSWPAEAIAVQMITIMAATALAATVPAFKATLNEPGQLTREDL